VRAYGDALELQRAVARAVIDRSIPDDVLLLMEHPPVITLGRSSHGANMLASPAHLAARGVERFEVERGGDVTFHGPGQLVGYPILDLKRHRQDLHWYLRQVEQALILAVGEFGIAGIRREKYTGVWVASEGYTMPLATTPEDPTAPHRPDTSAPQRKLASIGVHARDWVTWHGFALNVSTDLAYFDLIVPCGIPDVVMTTMAREASSRDVSMREVRASLVRAFCTVFGMVDAPEPPGWLDPLLSGIQDARPTG